MSRRKAARLMAGSAAGLLIPGSSIKAQQFEQKMTSKLSLLTRAIPSSGERLPVVGLGTWQTFDVGSSASERQPLEEVLSLFAKLGGKVVDSSPMYGRSESVIGEIASKLRLQRALFLATKVWTTGKQAGINSMERSMTRLQTTRIDLMQVHNLVDAETHLTTMRDWREQGRIRYLGITHYNSSGYAEVEKILRREKMDFVQINYSILAREAEARILPLAQERDVAVIINRPFGGGDLFARVRSKPLPEWAAEFDCKSWAQFLLKWIVANAAVTCAIPATNNPRHLEDNIQAGSGRLPEPKMRQRMVQLIEAI